MLCSVMMDGEAIEPGLLVKFEEGKILVEMRELETWHAVNTTVSNKIEIFGVYIRRL